MKRFLAILVLVGFATLLPIDRAHGQDVAVKTNLLYDATRTINLGLEVGLAPRWTIDISGNYNAWKINESADVFWKHYMVQPELRYWFCDRFSGHFLGLHGLGGKYNFSNMDNDIEFLGTDFSKLSDYRYQGWAVGAGIGYGYQFVLGRHWNLELEIGAGYIYTEYDKFECPECGARLEEDVPYHYWGITKAAVSIVFLF
ncbi:MAG: DUF3575 domain-containing protein [Rikenellaceae bacterium]|nr:DUF3575 domain-containing protein [Rikenellaceae bacterium]